MIELHCHSTASDGRLSPEALIRHAQAEGLRALVLTDHDTTAGVAEARKTAAEVGLIFRAGVEIEVDNATGEFHLLGLGVDDLDPRFQAGLGKLQELRKERNLRIFAKMKDAGLSGDYSDVVALAGDEGLVGRPHFARWLVKRQKVATVQDAFDKFLGKGQLFYEKKAALPLQEALELIHGAGGTAVLAHPLSLYLTLTKLEEALVEWKSWGLDGIEAFHPGAAMSKCRQFEDLGRRLGLKISAGSDFHGENRPDRRLGHTAGGLVIGDEFLEEILGISPAPAEDKAT